MDRDDLKRTFLWSLASVAAIAAFWAVWHLIAGSVPTVSMLRLTDSWTINLPFSISRWWDIVGGTLWAAIIAATFGNRAVSGNKDRKSWQATAELFSAPFGFFSGLAIGFEDALRAALASCVTFVGIGAILYAGTLRWADEGTKRGPPFAYLGAGIGFGFFASLGAGGFVGLATGLTIGLALTLASLLVFAFLLVATQSAKIWKRAKQRWRTLRELPTRNGKEIEELRRALADHQTRLQRAESQRDNLQVILSWCATREGITLEELRVRCIRAQQQEKLIAAWQLPLDEVELDSRLRKVLAAKNIRCLGDIAAMTWEELRGIQGIGKSSRAEIHRLLNKHGLDFSMRRPEGLPLRPAAPETQKP